MLAALIPQSSSSHPTGGGGHLLGVYWPWIVVPLVLGAALVVLVAASLVIVRRPPVPRIGGVRAPWWATGVPDRAAALLVVAEAERALHAHDPLLQRALFAVRSTRADRPELVHRAMAERPEGGLAKGSTHSSRRGLGPRPS